MTDRPTAAVINASVPLRPRDRFHRPRRFPWKQILSLATLLGALALGTQWPHYTGTSVCQTCGIRRDYFAWDARFFPATIYRFGTDRPSLVSGAFASHQPAPAHRHDWTASLIAASAPDEAGQTPPNLLYSVEAPRVAHFAAHLARDTEPDVLKKWKRVVLDPRYPLVLDASLHYMRFPDEGFSDPAAFRAWWRGAEFILWNRLRELTEPD